MNRVDDHYAFGANWRRFLGRLTPERVERARESLRSFLGMEDLRGRTFLDIGCGSGLFSLCAHELGAARVLSFDLDPQSAACARELHRRAGSPETWEIREGSVLDPAFMQGLGRWDVVYSWGVLHHTGEMWRAVEAAAARTEPGGLFYLALYNHCRCMGFHPDGRFGSSRFWWWEKRIYNALPRPLQHCVNGAAYTAMVLLYLLTLRNPVTAIRHHRSLRGMDWATDIRDWLGGWPYEAADAGETVEFLGARGFTLERLRTPGGLLNNEYLFRRQLM